MREQAQKISDAFVEEKLAERIAKIKKQKSLNYLKKIDKHLLTLRTLHFYGSTEKEVAENKSDDYFSTWFDDANNGDIHAMHSILDHFEPLEIITNMGHNYRSKFSEHAAEIILDFRPDHVIPQNEYQVEGVELNLRPLTVEEKKELIKPYLYSCILRIAKELMLYFPLEFISFKVNCPEMEMKEKEFSVSSDQVQHFLKNENIDDFTDQFKAMVLK